MKRTQSNTITRKQLSPKNSPVITLKKCEKEKEEDNFDEIVRYERNEMERNYDECERIFKRMYFNAENKRIYTSLLETAKILASQRIRNAYLRLRKCIGGISYCHDIHFSYLYVFIGNMPTINKKTQYFYLHIDPEEDMSKLYLHCSYMIGETPKHTYSTCSFDDLKNVISNHIIDYLSKFRS